MSTENYPKERRRCYGWKYKKKKIQKVILNNRKVTLSDIAKILSIWNPKDPKHWTHYKWIFEHEKAVGKVGATRGYSRSKPQRVDDLKNCLVFLGRYVTMDETWLHHYTPESNRRSSEWTAREEPTPKCRQAVGRQGYGTDILGCSRYNIHLLPPKEQDYQQQLLCRVVKSFKGWNGKKTASFKK